MVEHESNEMPFLDHLEELRWRIIWSLVALVVAVGAAFAALMKIDVIGILERPISPYLQGGKLVFTHPGDAFSIVLNAAVVLGIVIALPIILYQIWAFVSPALHRNEKKVVVPLFFFATFLFLAGVALAFFVVLPLAVEWLMGFQTQALEPMITASDYFSFA
ncbi:MAG TPA: twin-arginine translocase subunit TatC, partial [Gemmatimonadaceae bacterium]